MVAVMANTETTTRQIIFRYVDNATKVVSGFTKIPAGTKVYVGTARNGSLNLRIPGTLLTANVNNI